MCIVDGMYRISKLNTLYILANAQGIWVVMNTRTSAIALTLLMTNVRVPIPFPTSIMKASALKVDHLMEVM